MGKEQSNEAVRPSYRRLEELSSYFVNSASSVQDFTERFERIFRLYIRPGLILADESFERKPIMTVLALVFLTLSFIPVFIYLVLSFVTISAFILTAMVSAVIASAGALLLYSTVLVSILFGLAIASGFLTVMIVSSFLLLRLGLLVRQDGFSGALLWASDIKNYVLGGNAQSPPHEIANKDALVASETFVNISPKVEQSDSLESSVLVTEQQPSHHE